LRNENGEQAERGRRADHTDGAGTQMQPPRASGPVPGAFVQVSRGPFNSSSNSVSAFDSILSEIVRSKISFTTFEENTVLWSNERYQMGASRRLACVTSGSRTARSE
jgi:hypothetical protein